MPQAHMVRPVTLYNTLKHDIDQFKPINPGEVSVYCCGPTVYNYQHIGNMRTYIFEDVLTRTLRAAGYDVKHVMNITDVGHLVSDSDDGEDKMMVAMRREKKRSHEIADFYTGVFFDDCAKLHIKRPDVVCKATDHIQEMIKLIERIMAAGMAYLSNGNVYFDVATFPSYGDLARLDLEAQRAGARVEVDSDKRNPQDFALWFTKSKFENQELQWDSPWGRGYPGWHIECSAMSMKYLGEVFDIHCGGIDHIPVHHTNEIAQSEAATGKPWVNYWMHGEFLLINSEKMGKSKGNFFKLQDVIDAGFDPLTYRFLILSSHYRLQLNFTWDILKNTAAAFTKLKNAIIQLKEQIKSASEIKATDASNAYANSFLTALCDDLNVSKGLGIMQQALGDSALSNGEKLACLYEMDAILGFGFEQWQEEIVSITPEFQALLDSRKSAKESKDFKRADEIRNEFAGHGLKVVDAKDGTQTLKKL